MANTLLIWEEIPDTTKLYLIPNTALDDEALRTLALAHGKYINSTEVEPEEETALDCINTALCEKPEHLGENAPEGWAHKWAAYKVDEEKPLEAPITRVFRTGFLL